MTIESLEALENQLLIDAELFALLHCSNVEHTKFLQAINATAYCASHFSLTTMKLNKVDTKTW